MSISWLPRPWELARILPNFIFYVNQASKPHFNEFPFFQKISRVISVGIRRFPNSAGGLFSRIFFKLIISKKIIKMITKINKSIFEPKNPEKNAKT